MPTYLVTGATGNQGKSVVDYLLETGVTVHATVRDRSAPKAVALEKRGVILFEGTHDEPEQVFRAASAGCSGIFLNLSIVEPGKAKAQAEAIISACKAGAGSTLTAIVLSSAYRTHEFKDDPATPASIHPFLGGYYISKAEVESVVRQSQIEHYTILRAPILMYDLLLPHSAGPAAFPRLPKEGVLVTSLDEGRTMPYLDETDMGRITAAVFRDPAKFSGHEIEIAGDSLSPSRVCDVLSRVSGIEVRAHRRTAKEVEESRAKEFFQVFEALENLRAAPIDVGALQQKYGFKTNSLEEYLTRNKETLLKSLPPLSAV